MFNNKMQDDLKQSEYAKLFLRYFNYSQGNIGVALFSWTANIIDYKENVLYVKSVKNEDTDFLDRYDQDVYLVLVQFILHKRLTIYKLTRVMLADEDTIIKQIAYLKRSGIIVEEVKGTYEINKFLFIHIKEKLIELGMV